MNLRRMTTLLAVALFTIASAADAAVHRVHPGESIQAAIDAASPGDTILVDPGTYQEDPSSTYGLHITTDNLRLIGKGSETDKVRLLANGGQETGVFAAPPGCGYKDSACGGELQGFYIRGFSVEGFPQNGIQTRWVNEFKMIRNESINNLNNGIYPTLSANGLVQNNVSYGSLDTSLWVAGSENVRVIGNDLYGSPIGFEITVSNNVWATHNDVHDNTVGFGLFHPNAAGNPQLPVMENWVIEHNRVYNNNLPNPAPPASFQAGLPPGAGIMLLGVSNHVISKNKVWDNDLVGIAVLGWCTATATGDPSRNCVNYPPQADPATKNNLVSQNHVRGNAGNPTPGLEILAADITFASLVEASTGNCFVKNRFDTVIATTANGELPTDGC